MFTKDEAKSLADFINYVYTNAEFPSAKKASQARNLTKLFNEVAVVQKKVDANVFEVTAIEPSRKDEE